MIQLLSVYSKGSRLSPQHLQTLISVTYSASRNLLDSKSTGLQWSVCLRSWRNMHTRCLLRPVEGLCWCSSSSSLCRGADWSPAAGFLPSRTFHWRARALEKYKSCQKSSEWMTTGPRCVSKHCLMAVVLYLPLLPHVCPIGRTWTG